MPDLMRMAVLTHQISIGVLHHVFGENPAVMPSRFNHARTHRQTTIRQMDCFSLNHPLDHKITTFHSLSISKKLFRESIISSL